MPGLDDLLQAGLGASQQDENGNYLMPDGSPAPNQGAQQGPDIGKLLGPGVQSAFQGNSDTGTVPVAPTHSSFVADDVAGVFGPGGSVQQGQEELNRPPASFVDLPNDISGNHVDEKTGQMIDNATGLPWSANAYKAAGYPLPPGGIHPLTDQPPTGSGVKDTSAVDGGSVPGGKPGDTGTPDGKPLGSEHLDPLTGGPDHYTTHINYSPSVDLGNGGSAPIPHVDTDLETVIKQGQAILANLNTENTNAQHESEKLILWAKGHPYPHSNGIKFGTRDLLWAIPALIAAFSGSHMQELAGGLLKGALQGKGEEAARATEDAVNKWNNDAAVAKMPLEAANAKKVTAQQAFANYMAQSTMLLTQGGKAADRQVKETGAILGLVGKSAKTPNVAADAIEQGVAGGQLDPAVWTPDKIAAIRAGNPQSALLVAQATLAGAKTGVAVADANWTIQKTKFALDDRPSNVNNLHLKNQKLIDDMKNHDIMATAAATNAQTQKDRAATYGRIGESIVDMNMATAATIKPLAQSKIDSAYEAIAHYVNQDQNSWDKTQFEKDSKTMGIGLSALQDEIKERNESIKNARAEYTKISALAQGEKDQNGPLHTQLAGINTFINNNNTELNNVLYPAQTQLTGYAKPLRGAMGINEDGSKMTPKELATAGSHPLGGVGNSKTMNADLLSWYGQGSGKLPFQVTVGPQTASTLWSGAKTAMGKPGADKVKILTSLAKLLQGAGLDPAKSRQ